MESEQEEGFWLGQGIGAGSQVENKMPKKQSWQLTAHVLPWMGWSARPRGTLLLGSFLMVSEGRSKDQEPGGWELKDQPPKASLDKVSPPPAHRAGRRVPWPHNSGTWGEGRKSPFFLPWSYPEWMTVPSLGISAPRKVLLE